MRWPIVSVIFRREVRDQLRDRRTLFMIFVLPMLLYPIIALGGVKFQEAFAQRTRTVWLIGAEFLPDDPPLLDPTGRGFNPSLFDTKAEAERMVVDRKPSEPAWLDRKTREQAIRVGAADAIVTLPSDLRDRLARLGSPEIPIDYDSADESSQVTYLRVREVLARWRQSLTSRRVRESKLPEGFVESIKVKAVDTATEAELGSSVWAKLFPFLLVMMSLTGAFYPAIDLCAGEKERGTMETLLISPASRPEIVMGKFFTVLLASVMTALLNLVSMGLTGMHLARKIVGAAAHSSILAPPSLESAFWIVLLLVPLAAFFSAVCLALAVLARSMKEGQYYMTPLYLVCLPLIFLTLVPEIKINLFYSLVPITGVSLLLRALILGDYQVAARFFLPVMVTTVCYGLVALRWAVDQFQSEDVLFREAERFDLRVWVRHLVRDRGPTPDGAQALLCFAVMICLSWFMALSGLSSTAGMAAGQVAFVLAPPLLMTFLLTSSPRRTLRLYWPEGRYLALAVGLALALNPLVNELRPVVERLFPMSKDLEEALKQMMGRIPNVATMLLLFAVIPAVCEEVAFRGFILSGLEKGHKARAAIVMSAVLFGFMHALVSLYQQIFNATLLGLVLGLLAVRSRSLLPGVVFHVINNTLAVLMGVWLAEPAARRYAEWVYRDPSQGLYHWGFVAAGLVFSAVMLTVLRRDPGGAEPVVIAELPHTVAHAG